MKKNGGIVLFILGVVLLTLSALQAFNLIVWLLDSSTGDSSNSIGYFVFVLSGIILFSALGYKSITKGKSLIKTIN